MKILNKLSFDLHISEFNLCKKLTSFSRPRVFFVLESCNTSLLYLQFNEAVEKNLTEKLPPKCLSCTSPSVICRE